jgi:hypothetical protein
MRASRKTYWFITRPPKRQLVRSSVVPLIGGATGAAIGAEGELRPGGYRYYQDACYQEQPEGAWLAVSPEYCAPVSRSQKIRARLGGPCDLFDPIPERPRGMRQHANNPPARYTTATRRPCGGAAMNAIARHCSASKAICLPERRLWLAIRAGPKATACCRPSFRDRPAGLAETMDRWAGGGLPWLIEINEDPAYPRSNLRPCRGMGDVPAIRMISSSCKQGASQRSIHKTK